ncbi:MAG: hypothetical protein J6N95_03905 [Bacilli bacterium]|nr:hypothetical protein [Bacilli bacterium]
MDVFRQNWISLTVQRQGGLFKTGGVAQKYLASILDSEVSVMKTAGEGGAWGMAILALSAQKKVICKSFWIKKFLNPPKK